MKWWPFSSRQNQSSSARVSLDRGAGEQRVRMTRVAHRIRWARDILKIIWTAGPVTLIGLTGGFFLAYGHLPPARNLLYFFIFSLLSGLIAFFAKVIYDMTHGQVEEEAEQDVMNAIDRLADLILAVRDLMVASVEEGEARNREAALQLLRRIELTADGVALAVQELTGDSELARIIGRIETYRRAGLYTRVADLNRQYRERLDTSLGWLSEVSPEAVSILKDRFSGKAPQLEKGVPRDEFFIERVLAAIEEDNLLLMTLQDVEEMLILAFELINGREIPMLIFSYSGRWKLARALDDLENKRSQYRIAQASSSNRLHALASFLVETDEVTHAQLPKGLSSTELISRIVEILDQLAADIHQQLPGSAFQPASERKQLRNKVDVLAKALTLYKAARQSYQQLGKAHAALIEASNHWNQLFARFASSHNQLSFGPGRTGLRILETIVWLPDDARTQVCQHLMRYLESAQMEKRGRRIFARSDARDNKPLTLEGARRLAVEVALALEPHIHLSRPAIQRGLNASNASYLGRLEPDMSASEKAALGTAMAREVQQDMGPAAERLAVALVKHYRVELTDDARNFLIDTYGARPQMLDILRNHEVSSAINPVSFLSLRPPRVAPIKRQWYQALIGARYWLG